MPRKKARSATQDANAVLPDMQQPVLALPPGRPMRHGDRPIDAYESPPGAVHQTRRPLDRPLTNAEKRNLVETRTDQKMRAMRYEAYVDALAATGGNKVAALASVYNRSEDAVLLEYDYLIEDVRTGLGSTSLSKRLEAADLGEQAQVQIIRKHVYSPNPAASLKALDMLREWQGNRTDGLTSFEETLKLAKLGGG